MMGCRPAAKSKVEEGCGRGQLEATSSSPRCTEVIELPTETRIVQKREDRGTSGAGGTDDEEEEEELGRVGPQWTRWYGLSIGASEPKTHYLSR